MRSNIRRNPKSVSVGSLGGWIFGIIGVILIVSAAIVYYVNTNTIKNCEKTTAVISQITSHRESDGDTSHSVYVTYTVEDKLYENVRLSLYSSDMYEGKTIDVYYEPDNPGKIHIKNPVFVYVILLVIGIIFSIVGFSIVKGCGGGSKRRMKLMQTGMLVTADVTYSGRSGVTINGRLTYRAKATWNDDMGNTIEFKTSLLSFDPTAYIMLNQGKLNVYVDRTNSKKYYINTEEFDTFDCYTESNNRVCQMQQESNDNTPIM